jgi:hypothetical protein
VSAAEGQKPSLPAKLCRTLNCPDPVKANTVPHASFPGQFVPPPKQVVPYNVPDASRVNVAIGLPPPAPPVKVCSTMKLPNGSSLKTVPHPPGAALARSVEITLLITDQTSVRPVTVIQTLDTKQYLRFVDDIYQSDAYHSLSIERYSVTPALIERVQRGDWDPDLHDKDRKNRDALAARGYWQAFQTVKTSVAEIINGGNAGALVRTAHKNWYGELFQPCIAAGLIPAAALAGYRNDAVYLRTSHYVPPRWEAVRDTMPALFDLLEGEVDPGVRAVPGHWLFGYIHRTRTVMVAWHDL